MRDPLSPQGRPRLLMLSRYDRMGASSRLRSMQYIPHFEAAGLHVEVASLFDAAYLTSLYSGAGRNLGTLGHYMRRLKHLTGSGTPAAIWVEKEALPWLPWLVERALLPRGVPLISDHDDAIFHKYDLHRRGLVRGLLGQKIDRVMAASALVVAGNNYLADRARRAGARNIEIVPTVVDAATYAVAPPPAAGHRPRVGWIGTPVTWASYGADLLMMLRGALVESGALFRAVGAGPALQTSDHVENLPWTEDSEVRLIQDMDIGVMPLDHTPWSRGKCGYKLIQYMACGVPVIASPVGANTELVRHGENGFLAESPAERAEALGRLLASPELRARMGAAGRSMVEETYSLQAQGPRLARLVADLARPVAAR